MSDNWRGLYSEGWQGEITPEAFSHPAKFSRALIRRIYEHAVGQGWLQAGDTVIDPFAGVCLGALDSMRLGLHWRGVELEQRFVDLGWQNIDQWNTRYGPHMPRWGSAEIVQGDSRELASVLGGADGVVSSPPYADGCAHTGGDDPKPEHIQGGKLRGVGIDGCISSPPYTESMEKSGGIDPAKSNHIGGPHSQMNNSDTRYGSTPGQLGAMKADGFDAAVSSPPFMNSDNRGSRESFDKLQEAIVRDGNGHSGKLGPSIGADYGSTDGNIGNSNGDNFWEAARAIVDQVYTVLRPGGHAIWVTKRFVKNKQIVEFSDQWQQLCEAAGFRLVCRHRAWLVEDRGTQGDLFGGAVTKTVERKSFFRRLAEAKGSPRIDWEDVICMVKE